MSQGVERRPLGGSGDESNRSGDNPSGGATRRKVNESMPEDGVTTHAPAAQPNAGHNHVHAVANQEPLEGKVAGDYSHLLHEPKISSTKHPLPKDVAAFDHHFSKKDAEKKKKS
jgi:hypothetical protein